METFPLRKLSCGRIPPRRGRCSHRARSPPLWKPSSTLQSAVETPDHRSQDLRHPSWATVSAPRRSELRERRAGEKQRRTVLLARFESEIEEGTTQSQATSGESAQQSRAQSFPQVPHPAVLRFPQCPQIAAISSTLSPEDSGTIPSRFSLTTRGKRAYNRRALLRFRTRGTPRRNSEENIPA